MLRPRSHGCAGECGGFSLIEVTCCIVIVGVLAALAGPRLLDDQPFVQRGYVDQVASALRYARQVAVASGCDVSFVVNGAGAYSAAQRAAAGNGITCAAAGPFSQPVVWSDGTTLAATGAPPSNAKPCRQASVTFLPRGALAGGGAPIVLSCGGFSVTVDAGSGLVTEP